MPLVVAIKGIEKTYLFTDNCQYLGGSVLVKEAPRQFALQKFNNFVIGYYGSSTYFFKLAQAFDFDSFPEPLTKGYLMRNFYAKFLEFLVKETKCTFDTNALTNSDFGIMILGKDYAFDIGSEYLYQVRTINACGDDRLAFQLHSSFKDKMSEEELIKVIMEKSAKYAYRTSYPYIMVDSSDLDHYVIVSKDGKKKKEKFIQYWGKK